MKKKTNTAPPPALTGWQQQVARMRSERAKTTPAEKPKTQRIAPSGKATGRPPTLSTPGKTPPAQ